MRNTRYVSLLSIVLLAGLVALARSDETKEEVKEKAFDAPNGDFACVRRGRSGTKRNVALGGRPAFEHGEVMRLIAHFNVPPRAR